MSLSANRACYVFLAPLSMQITHLETLTKFNCQFVFLFLTLKAICLQIIFDELFILQPREAISASVHRRATEIASVLTELGFFLLLPQPASRIL